MAMEYFFTWKSLNQVSFDRFESIFSSHTQQLNYSSASN
ncbi:hypothetical protein GXM_02293 [Nostoc sphaeroides CCNUC1]|uniref:Uncharacterized protein n=1 Tax=Nostoc sphaeroides CCNUC1 TaxID=2653204 RepID=A0A5P8VWN0_9NOSO|nr:hypothetical protein GXM_02293 [Nostoc sphaeroides CCNUC1]